MKGKVETMTTKELIERLQQLDPDGNCEIILDGCYYYCPMESEYLERVDDKIYFN